MEIPKRFKIANTEYEVQVVDKSDDGNYGYHNDIRRKIVVAKSMDDEGKIVQLTEHNHLQTLCVNTEPHEPMSYKKQIDIASKVGELLVGMTGKTLSKDEQDDMFKDIFEQTLRLMSRFTSDVIEAMYDSTENWDEFLELIKER